MNINRRQFLKTAGAGIAAVAAFEVGARSGIVPLPGAFAASGAPQPEQLLGTIPEDPQARLILRMSELNRLPWFEKDDKNQLRLATGTGLPPVIDVHSHVGWSQGLGADIDMTVRSQVRYFWDYEIVQDFLNVQLHPTQSEASAMAEETKYLVFKTPARTQTHTAANLVAEMERFNHTRSVLLPVEIPVRSRHAEQTRRGAAVDNRLIAFSGIHPWRWSEDKEKTLAATFILGTEKP